jgi:uncharacterized protein YbjT (DUF2867 family)
VAKDKTVLVIGATGGMGGATALAFLRHGWRIRALHRRPDEASSRFAHLTFAWVKGDAMNAADVVAAAEGARFIVHGAGAIGRCAQFNSARRRLLRSTCYG